DWFIEAALASADEPLRFIYSGQRRLVLRSLLSTLKSQFRDLEKLVDTNQFLQEVDAWMSNLFEANVTRWPDDGGAWWRDLQVILQKYDSWKKQQRANLRDAEFAPRIFARSSGTYPDLPQQIIIESAVTLSPNQREGLQRLISDCESVTVTLVAPGIGQHCQTWPELQDFAQGSLLENSLKFWQEQNAEVEILESENLIYADKLNDLKSLAQSRRDIYQTSISSAHTPRSELRQIATSLREKSDDIHEVAKSTILLNNSSGYSDVLKSTFAEFGLPLRRLPRQSLLALPLVQIWMQLLNLPKENWKVSTLVVVFSGGALEFKIDERKLDVRNIEKAAAILRQHTVDDLEEFSALLTRSNFIRELDVDEAKKEIPVLAALQQRLSEIDSAASHRDWLHLVTQLWLDVTAHWKGETSNSAEIAKRQINDLKRELKSLEQKIASLQKYFPENVAIWQSQLQLALSDATASGEVGIRSGVDAIAVHQLQQEVPEIIYWPGMSESDFPSISSDALQARHQKTIRELCPHLPSPTAQSVYWMALALAEASEIHF
ncbi:MAG: hypothetical protein ABI210_14630, partial [Abditibacteriaceae bacterium]